MDKPQNHLDLEFQISQYLDGQLSRRQAAMFERRLQRDEALRRELRRYTALESELSAMGQAELQDVDYADQRAEIMSALERRQLLEVPLPRRRLVLRPVFAVLAAAAVLVLVAGVAVRIFRSTAPPKTVVQVAVLPMGPAPSSDPAEVKVVLRQPDWGDIRMAATELAHAEPGMPAGTVLVSFSRPAQQADLAYPMWID